MNKEGKKGSNNHPLFGVEHWDLTIHLEGLRAVVSLGATMFHVSRLKIDLDLDLMNLARSA